MKKPNVKLKRILGFWPAYGAAVGLVVSGTAMVSVGNVAGLSGYIVLISADGGTQQVIGGLSALTSTGGTPSVQNRSL
jgi:hypothetical protein